MGARQIKAFIVDSTSDLANCPQDAWVMLRRSGVLGVYGYDPIISAFRFPDFIPITDSATAFQFKNAAGARLIAINTLFDNPLGSGFNRGQIVIGNQGALSASVGLMNEMVSIIEDATTTADLHGLVIRKYSNDTGNASMSILKSRGATPGAIAAIQSGDLIGTINFYGDDGNLSASPLANPVRIRTQATENWSTTAHGCKMFFVTCPNGSTAQAISLTVDNDGTIYAGQPASTTTRTVGFSGQAGSGTDNAGSDGILRGGSGTGAGAGGVARLQTAPASASGSSLNTYNDNFISAPRKTVATNGAGLNLFKFALPTLTGIGGSITYTVFASDGTNLQSRRGFVMFSAVNKAGSVTTEMPIISEAVSASSGTLTASWASTFASNELTIQVTPTSSLTPTTFWVQYTLTNNSGQAVTLL